MILSKSSGLRLLKTSLANSALVNELIVTSQESVQERCQLLW